MNRATDRKILFLKTYSNFQRIEFNDILLIQAFGDYVKFCTEDKVYLSHTPMSRIEDMLASSNFIRVHRSFIVNISKISRVTLNKIEINNYKIPVSKSYRHNLLNQIVVI
ncbi:MAG: LytTR family transcriptional regulator [Cyclobacteriaceae bacterium]|nr:LytTR family transcriptional regulator [Cyclobacteriaceae bacterium]